MSDDLKTFVSDMKIHLIKEIEKENDPLKKILIADEHMKQISEIIRSYEKVLLFIDGIKKEAIQEDPKVLDKVAFINMISIGLKVKPDKNNEKMIVDFENSKFFKEVFQELPAIEKPLYKRIANKFVEDLNDKLEYKIESYNLQRDVIKDLGWEIF